MVSVTGLLYVATVEKLQFRLTAVADQADGAEQQWRQALVTLRTVSGELPPAEGPGQPAVVIEAPKPTTTLRPEDPAKRPVRGTVPVAWKADGRDLRVLLPLGWSLAEDGRLGHPRLAGVARFTVRAESRNAAERNHQEQVKEGLASFAVVGIRRDVAGRTVASGATAWATFREGDDAQGRLGAGLWSLHHENLTWVVTYRSALRESIGSDKRLLDDLAKLLFVEPGS
jgi:hypothetical protein